MPPHGMSSSPRPSTEFPRADQPKERENARSLRSKTKTGLFFEIKKNARFFFPATWWPHLLRSTRSRPPCFAATSGDWQKSRTGKTTPKTARKRIQPIVRGARFIHRQRTQRAAPGLLRRQHTQPAVPAQRTCWQTQRAGQRDAAYWQIRQRPPGNALSPWCALPASSTDGAAARSAHARAPFASSAAHAAARSSCVHAGEREGSAPAGLCRRRHRPPRSAATSFCHRPPPPPQQTAPQRNYCRHRPPRSATTAPQRARLADWQPPPQTAPQRNYFFLPQTAPAATDHRPPHNARAKTPPPQTAPQRNYCPTTRAAC